MPGLEPERLGRQLSYGRADLDPRSSGPANLADILERVLDKGIVIAGDVQINLLDIELLTIRLRLLITSVDRAKEMGINWWESDPTLTTDAELLQSENRELRDRLARLERLLGASSDEEETAHATAVGQNAEARASTKGEKTRARASSDSDA